MENTFEWSHGYKPRAAYAKRAAYFSMEFAIDQALKTYSGGLGYLAGSHMRSAYELKQNLIGIGMLWKHGYYDQTRGPKGYMDVLFRRRKYTFLQDTGIKVPVFVHGSQVMVKAYYLAPEVFNTVPMFFLSTDLTENDYLSRSITNRLYHSNDAARVAQSIVLGIGGAKVVEALGGADVYHLNEAHALPLAFHLYNKLGSVKAVQEQLVFTTHTPEKAGNSTRSIELLNEMEFFNGVDLETVREITQMHGDNFEYTPAALRLSKRANGVSKLHGIVSNEMWKDCEGRCEIIPITNAQNQKYWQDPILAQHLKAKKDKELWARKRELKKELFKVVVDQTGKLMDPDVLTIVWARRYAGYKRADLIMQDLDRFLKLLEQDRGVQMIWAGKPYPEDSTGIAQFNQIAHTIRQYPNAAILTGYELKLSAQLKKGSDVWLNTPRRPQEASGTSGMTAAMNASVNLSTDDGWIPEFANSGVNSFVIPPADLTSQIHDQDNHDHEHLMQLLEDVIVPMYYNEPKKWLKIVKTSMRDVVPYFDSGRMAKEYYTKLYV